MLPHKMKISEQAFNSLRRLQTNTGLTINVSARLAFFSSIERGYIYSNEEVELKHRELDKYTWLGNYSDLVEMLLKQKYPDLDKQGYYRAWASHVDDGALMIEAKSSLSELI
jgi:DNA sulfur modification protein DndE